MTNSSTLTELGYTPFWQALFEPHADAGLNPARVIRSDRGSAIIATAAGIVRAKPSQRLQKAAGDPADLPTVGDWTGTVTPDDADVTLIETVLERKSVITRSDPGKTTGRQVLAANIDTVFVVQPIADGPNLRRIERELSLAWDSGAIPVVVLTKADLSTDPETAKSSVEAIALGTDVLLVNALETESAEMLLSYVTDYRTAVLIGPSGAGKSTLINALLGEQRQATRDVRMSDGKGRHTTVARELIKIPGYGILIDTPGLRALGLTGSREGISAVFPDIEEIARECRFRDCSHQDEIDCAVRSAVDAGRLTADRLASYHKLVSEARTAARKSDVRLRLEEKRKWKLISKAAKEYNKRGKRS